MSMWRRPSTRIEQRRHNVVLVRTVAFRSKVSGFSTSQRSGPVLRRPSTSPPSAQTSSRSSPSSAPTRCGSMSASLQDRPVVGAGVPVPLGQPEQARHHAQPRSRPGTRALPAASRPIRCRRRELHPPRHGDFPTYLRRHPGSPPRRRDGQHARVGSGGTLARPAGFATTMEQASGMAFVTGYDDGPPMAPGLCDPSPASMGRSPSLLRWRSAGRRVSASTSRCP